MKPMVEFQQEGSQHGGGSPEHKSRPTHQALAIAAHELPRSFSGDVRRRLQGPMATCPTVVVPKSQECPTRPFKLTEPKCPEPESQKALLSSPMNHEVPNSVPNPRARSPRFF